MAALVALLIGVDLFIPSSEGHGIPTITAVVALLGSIGALPLVAFRLPKALVALATILGCLFFAGYAMVLVTRASYY
jgi:tetrahydromethanopterin S-methyltransferase subunit D